MSMSACEDETKVICAALLSNKSMCCAALCSCCPAAAAAAAAAAGCVHAACVQHAVSLCWCSRVSCCGVWPTRVWQVMAAVGGDTHGR
jgi:hypothetical protein